MVLGIHAELSHSQTCHGYGRMGMVTHEMQPRFVHSSILSPVSLRGSFSLRMRINGAVQIPPGLGTIGGEKGQNSVSQE
jgi:hypothetical protein